jgi:hypothetical protein
MRLQNYRVCGSGWFLMKTKYYLHSCNILALKSLAEVPLTHREKPILVFIEDPAQQLQKP